MADKTIQRVKVVLPRARIKSEVYILREKC